MYSPNQILAVVDAASHIFAIQCWSLYFVQILRLKNFFTMFSFLKYQLHMKKNRAFGRHRFARASVFSFAPNDLSVSVAPANTKPI